MNARSKGQLSKDSWTIFNNAKKAALAGGACKSCAIAAGNAAEELASTGQASLISVAGTRCTCKKARAKS